MKRINHPLTKARVMVKKGIVVVSPDDNCIKNLQSILEKALYHPVFVPSLLEAKARLEQQSYRILIIDLDQTTLDNRFLKELLKEYPVLGLIGLSSRRFHQELEEAMSRYIDACFEKSEGYEDLLYWLKAILDPSCDRESRGKGSKSGKGFAYKKVNRPNLLDIKDGL